MLIKIQTIYLIWFLFIGTALKNDKFVISSVAFKNGKRIPTQYANTGVADGKNISIPLAWENIPKGTKSFALTMVDLHPIANNWVHWLVINIPATVLGLQEGASISSKMPVGSVELNNTFGTLGYGGPQPPKGSGPHQYEVTIYALNIPTVKLDIQSTLSTFRKAIDGKVIATAKTVGIFER